MNYENVKNSRFENRFIWLTSVIGKKERFDFLRENKFVFPLNISYILSCN
jgi:hypothetical protein